MDPIEEFKQERSKVIEKMSKDGQLKNADIIMYNVSWIRYALDYVKNMLIMFIIKEEI